MALSNRQRIDKGLELLRDGLAPFIERELKSQLGDKWLERIEQGLRHPLEREKDGVVRWDTSGLLKIMEDQWNVAFKETLGRIERSYVVELKNVRNDHAHEKNIASEDTERALDTINLHYSSKKVFGDLTYCV